MLDFENTNTTSSDLSDVSELATKMVGLALEISIKEGKLKDLKEQHTKIESDELPDLMKSVGLSAFTLEDGSKIEIKDILKASLPAAGAIERAKPEQREELQARLEEGIEWLSEHGASAMVKNTVTAELGKDSQEEAVLILDFLNEHGFSGKSAKVVHPQTLTSYIKEQVAKGTDVPLDVFSVFTGHKASVSRSRK